MLKLDDLLVFSSKKSSRSKANNSTGIYFSITKNAKEYVGIRFYFGKEIAEKYKINENIKIKLGCDRLNNRKWFLILAGDGYTIRLDKTRQSYSCTMGFPFNFVDNKRMQYISVENIKYYDENNIISFSVEHIFNENELLLN